MTSKMRSPATIRSRSSKTKLERRTDAEDMPDGGDMSADGGDMSADGGDMGVDGEDTDKLRDCRDIGDKKDEEDSKDAAIGSNLGSE